MEGRTIIVGDHTGSIKAIVPQVNFLCNGGSSLSVINIIPRHDKFLAFRVNGSIEEFSLDGTFTTIKEPSTKIIGGSDFEGKELLVFPNGTFEFSSITTQSGISECKGFDLNLSSLSLCGKSNAEIWDINTAKLVWKARTKLPREEVFDTKCKLSENLLYTTTTKNEVKMHDIRTGKKPTRYIRLNPEGHIYDFPISSLNVTEDLIFVGDSIGHVYKLNQKFEVLGKTKGRSVGSIQCICVKENEIYSGGLDRRLMVHDIPSMKLLHKQYLWQKITSILVL